MTKLLAVLIACLALPLAACGSDDNSGGGGGGSSATPQSDTGAAKKPDASKKPAAKTVTVDMKDIKFNPKSVTVKAGTTVKWTNSDQVPHTVTKTAGPGAQFDSGSVDPGGEYQQTFDKKGKVDYVCEIHPGQAGSVTVE
jgi:plastocyanin